MDVALAQISFGSNLPDAETALAHLDEAVPELVLEGLPAPQEAVRGTLQLCL